MSDPRSMAAAEYVLGTLDLEERREIERRLASDPELRACIAEWEATLEPIADAVPPMAPSTAVWDQIEARVDADQRADNVVAFRNARRPVARRPLVVALGLIAATLVGVAVVRQIDRAPDAPPAAQVAAPSVAPVAPATPPTNFAARPCEQGSKLASGEQPSKSAVATATAPAGAGGLSVPGAAAAPGGSIASQGIGQGVVIASAPRESNAPTTASSPGEGCR